MRDWSVERVVIIGAARQGLALADYLLNHGAMVTITDRLPLSELDAGVGSLSQHAPSDRLKWVCGGHPFDLLGEATLVCPSGGVPLSLPLVKEALRRGIPLSNDSQVFLENAPCTVIGITGSAGKTTTTSLVGRIAEAAYSGSSRQVWVGGNIGLPLLSVVEKMSSEDLAVMELSSFQLEIMSRSPQIAAILNITPNHLDRHGSMDEYIAAKARILRYQTAEDCSIFGRDDPGAWSLAGLAPGRILSFGLSKPAPEQEAVFLKDDTIFLRTAGSIAGVNPASLQNKTMEVLPVIARREIMLRGEHNLQNAMAACAIASASGLSIESMRTGIKSFAGVPHRLEYVRTWGGADWYNDSIATAPERAIAAVRSFDESLILLAGGRDKKLPWDAFAQTVCQRVNHLILFGEAADLIYQAFEKNRSEQIKITRCKGLHEAVNHAAKVVQPGDVVLLSPGGTSFDEFKDFEERGKCFARWVRELP